MKPVNEILPSRLNSLIELAIRTCSSSKIDPYKNDIYIHTGSEELALQVFRINSINTAHEKGKIIILSYLYLELLPSGLLFYSMLPPKNAIDPLLKFFLHA